MEMNFPQTIYSTCSSAVEVLVEGDSMRVCHHRLLIAGPFGAAQFGGPGIRVHTFGGGRPRQRQQPQAGQPQQNSSFLYQLLPVLILLAITILPGIFSSSPTPPPSFVFEAAKPPLTEQRFTPQHSIPYFVNPAEVSSLSNSKLRQLDQKAELVYIRALRDQCQVEYESRQHRMMNAHGWWGTVRNQEEYELARATKLPSCDRLRGMGYRTEVY